MSKEQIMVMGIVAGFAVVFPLFWCFVVRIISRVGGWASLATAFAAESEPEGVRYGGRSMRIAPASNYNGCLIVVLSREGIYMVPSKIFRSGHVPLLLPWDCVEHVSEHRFLGRRLWVTLSAKGKQMTLVLPGSAEEVLRNFSRKQLSMQ